MTSTLRNDSTHQQFYRLWQHENAALAAAFGSFLNIPLGRTYDLHELWRFLRRLSVSVRKWGADQVDVSNHFVTDAFIRSRSALTYSPTTNLPRGADQTRSRKWVQRNGAYSGEVGPDQDRKM